MVSQTTISGKARRRSLIEIIKGSLSVDEIEIKIPQVRERVREKEEKDKILGKTDAAQLAELAQQSPSSYRLLELPRVPSRSPINIRTSRNDLLEMIKGSMSVEEIKNKVAEIRSRERRIKRAKQLATLRKNKVFAVFLLSIIMYSSFAVGSLLAYDNWNRSSQASPLTEDWSRTVGLNRFYSFYSVQQTRDGGYIMAGTTSLLNQFVGDLCLVKTDSAGDVQWNKTYAGCQFSPRNIRETSDGGYIILASLDQICLVKTDSIGVVQWNNTYTLQEIGDPYEILQTSDFGYVVGGYAPQSYSAVCLVKMDSGGIIEWKETYGSINCNYGISSILQAADNGYVIGGWVYSWSSSQSDFWLATIDQNGGMKWNRTYGGAGDDWGETVLIADDGCFVMSGETSPFDPIVQEALLIRTDPLGNMEWNETYSVNFGDPKLHFSVSSASVLQTLDHGYIMAGAYNGGFWLVRTDANGTEQWLMTIAELVDSYLYSIFLASGGGYVIAGETGVSVPSGEYLCTSMIVETDSSGIAQWSRTFGCHQPGFPVPRYGHQLSDVSRAFSLYSQVYLASSLLQTPDGGYVVAGTGCRLGTKGTEMTLTKLDSSGAVRWNKVYDEKYFDLVVSVLQTSDGGYVIAGSTCSWGYFGYWLVKTDSEGVMQWDRVYSDVMDAYLSSVAPTSDGGCILIGSEEGAGSRTWVVKTDSSGTMQWSRNYDNTMGGSLSSIVETSDGGYAMTGYTYLNDVPYVQLLKTDSNGSIQLNKVVEGTQNSEGSCILGTSNGGYIVAGKTYTTFQFILLIKVDSGGIPQWNKTYEEGYIESVTDLHQTLDGGYIIGATMSPQAVLSPNTIAGPKDLLAGGDHAYLLVKANSDGEMQWNMALGRAGCDFGFSALQTSGGGYIVAWYAGGSASDTGGLRIAKLSGLPLQTRVAIFLAGFGGATILFVCFLTLLCRREETKNSIRAA
ncbi:MAG: hypothetical protein WED04_05995 [Promethearchaeati archaeon SRVP18_Atabeyarchaeia-1]